MKKILTAAAILTVMSCKNSSTDTQNQSATSASSINLNKETGTQAATTDTQGSANAAKNCASVGELKEKFEQNGAKFEWFSKPTDPNTLDSANDWLKITLPDGSCKIVDSIGNANHYECAFEDWNGDGLKDRIDSYKWYKKVSLFSKTKNDFSDNIDGIFSGEQSDYDKSKGLKWQYLENKLGGTYQLYKMEGLAVKVLSEISINDNEPETITILKSLTQKDNKEVNAKTFLLPKKNGEEQTEASVKRYWNSISKTLK